jgi:hydrogenase maturation factor
MRHLLVVALLVLSFNVFAGDTLRVGQQVLSVGDTAVHAIDLLGMPAFKEPVQNKFGAYQGERWQVSRAGGHVVIVTIIAGKVAAIEDHTEEHRG